MRIGSRLRAVIKAGIARGLRPYGYRLINPAHRYGIDPIADVTRLGRLWNVAVETVFDVGANVGASALAYRAAWPACRVTAFEPNAVVARRLLANVAAVGGVSVEQVALSARSGSAEFYVHADDPVLSSLNATTPFTDRFGMRGEPVTVPVTTLDEFCDAHAVARINLLKVDAEGSDFDVLRGAERLLRGGQIDFVYCEFNALAVEAGNLGSLMPIATLLGAHGYNFIASYNDYVLTEGRFFAVSNALFAADRDRS